MRKMVGAIAAAGLLLTAGVQPSQAQSAPNTCEIVQRYGGLEVQDELAPGFYYLYVLDGGTYRAYRYGYSNGRIRFLLGQTTFDAYLIVTPEGQIVSAC